MELLKAERKQAKIKMGLMGPAGSGKTYSSILLAYGLIGDFSKIAIVDSERGSANLYSHLGSYYVLELNDPFTPEKFIDAINLCQNSGIECIILDSISSEWSGKGGILEIHEKTTSAMKIPNSFTAWASVTPRHQAFIDAILQSKCHIIATLRTKTEYLITERNGRNTIQKCGMAAIQRDGFEYEVSISLDIDDEHMAMSSKDRTGLFADKGKFRITPDTGKLILNFCNAGKSLADLKADIIQVSNIEHLRQILRDYPQYRAELEPLAITRKQQLENPIAVATNH